MFHVRACDQYEIKICEIVDFILPPSYCIVPLSISLLPRAIDLVLDKPELCLKFPGLLVSGG